MRKPAPPKCSTGSARRWADRGGEDLGLVYLQLALYLAPINRWRCCRSPICHEQVKNPQLAIKIYERMPQSSPLRRNAEIQMAVNLDTRRQTPTRPSSDCISCSRIIRPIIDAIMASAASSAAARTSPTAAQT
jgi:hypothetical protein